MGMNTTHDPEATVTTVSTRPWYRHPAAISVGAVAGSILLIGASVAITLELTDDLWSPEYSQQSQSIVVPVDPVDSTELGATAGSTEAVAGGAGDGSPIAAAVSAAVAAAGGVGATSVAVGGGMYEVDVLLADGREIDVYVGADGRAVVDSVPYVDPSGDPALDLARIPAIVDAALAAVAASTGATGTLYELSTTSAPGRAFDITVLLPNGGAVYLELANDLSVVEFDLD